jgi:hypothetical protein
MVLIQKQLEIPHAVFQMLAEPPEAFHATGFSYTRFLPT